MSREVKYSKSTEETIHKLRYEERLSLREIATIVFGAATKESTVRGILSSSHRPEKKQVGETSLLVDADVQKVYSLKDTGKAQEVASAFGVPVSTVKRIWDGEITSGCDPETSELVSKLHRTVQLQRDKLRVERKVSREQNRMNSVLEELTLSLIDVFDSHSLSEFTVSHGTKGDVVGVIQLSDLHFGERINDVSGNVFDTSVVAARLKKLADKAKQVFNGVGVGSVLIAMTGDIVNSDRRLDEIVTNSDNRANVLFTAVDILQQFILDINVDFNVTVASICGNESRIGKDIGWTNYMASDSFDAIIHNILSMLFKDSESVRFIEMVDPLECVVNVNGANFLLIHGHNGLSNTSRIENEVAKVKAKYGMQGVPIDYVISGHIHCAFISDMFARSSGLPGANTYSDKALGLTSKASQNIYLVGSDKSIDGMKVDLQQFDRENAYYFNEETEAYKKVPQQTTVTIQSVLV